MNRFRNFLMAAFIPLLASAWTVPDETLHYSVRFKWGFIDANVGIARIATINNVETGRFTATLSGKSVDLLGHYYDASDTITGSIMANGITLDENAHIYREKGRFAIETITGNATGPSDAGPVEQQLPDGKVIRSRVSEYGSGLTTDLLAVFYYMRQLDYGDHSPGQTFRINISDGNQVENLDISYIGTENVESNGTSCTAYHISLTFSTAGSSKTDNMNVWIATDSNRIPLIINGSLSVGHIECRYLDNNTLQHINRL